MQESSKQNLKGFSLHFFFCSEFLLTLEECEISLFSEWKRIIHIKYLLEWLDIGLLHHTRHCHFPMILVSSLVFCNKDIGYGYMWHILKDIFNNPAQDNNIWRLLPSIAALLWVWIKLFFYFTLIKLKAFSALGGKKSLLAENDLVKKYNKGY